MEDSRTLSGKTILVTGGADRIGKAIAISAAKNGANIALHYHRSKEEALQTTQEIATLGCRVLAIQGDISDLEQVERMRDKIQTEFGDLYGVVNNAGYVQMKPLFQYAKDEWKKEIDVCLNGVINLAYTFIPHMKEKGEGKFISIVGDSARMGNRNLIISAAARNGVISFIKSLALEVGQNQVQCNTVSLGLIDQGDLGMNEERMKKLIKNYPLNRLGRADDIVGIIDFLLSGNADWITGQVISVNGGSGMIG
ncbi:SDR family oxidoreductase [Lysinibacillus yapensis]|uniref:SDR family oxidoreductase n=1 Tax=Ureibacillus yapensis TaxID=2304605 RepID=A0A396SB97_9BACL|nr:SDR family oxidoreductase [Lysinibacillus yapensis]RHW38402.1 SDR family oxidoreductase [Lysinibacillus yapensis]